MKPYVMAGWIAVVAAPLLGGAAGTPARGVEASEVEIGEIIAENTCLEAFSCIENGVPEEECCLAGAGEDKNKCRGRMVLVDFALQNNKLTAESERSAQHCLQKLARLFDDFCVEKRLPGNCNGDCPADLPDCNDSGIMDPGRAKITKAGPPKWECEGTRGACGCRCRPSLTAAPLPPV